MKWTLPTLILRVFFKCISIVTHRTSWRSSSTWDPRAAVETPMAVQNVAQQHLSIHTKSTCRTSQPFCSQFQNGFTPSQTKSYHWTLFFRRVFLEKIYCYVSEDISQTDVFKLREMCQLLFRQYLFFSYNIMFELQLLLLIINGLNWQLLAKARHVWGMILLPGASSLQVYRWGSILAIAWWNCGNLGKHQSGCPGAGHGLACYPAVDTRSSTLPTGPQGLGNLDYNRLWLLTVWRLYLKIFKW